MAGGTSAPARISFRAGQSEDSRKRAPLEGHALLLAAPAHAKFLRLEPVLRRSIPVLIVTFLAVIGAFRVHALLDEHRTIEADARARVALIVTTTAAMLPPMQGQPEAVLAQNVQTMLANAFPSDAVLNGARILVSRADGRIIATWPQQIAWQGRMVADILGPDQPLMVMGARAGVVALGLPTGDGALAAVSHLEGALGAAAVLMSEDSVLASWRSHVRTNLIIFALTALIMVVMTYAYFAQIARAVSSDAIHKATQSRAEAAFRRARCALWDWDVTQDRLFWSSSMFELLGLKPGAPILTTAEAARHIVGDDLDLVALAPRLVAGEITALDTDVRLVRADGQVLWFRIRGEIAVRPETGAPHLIGIASDITEQKLAAEAGALADMRLRDAIETISEAFVLWDADNRIVICNGKYQVLHDLTDGDVRPGTPYAEVMRQARQPVVCTPIPQESREADGAVTYEAQIQDGRWLQINERRTKDGGFVSVGTDITQLKRHEERLVESEKRLLGTVMDLRQSRQKLELQAQQLVELAEKYAEEKVRAEEANKIKSDFLANISHELRTPLNAIIGFSEIMSEGVFGYMSPDKYAEYGRDIHASGQFLLNVINDILDMSKIEAGRMELVPEVIDLEEIAGETLRLIEPQAGEKGISVAREFETGLVIAADRRAIKQVMMNLISNAVKFTPQGGRVVVKARALPDAVTIAIEDTGIGIPAEEIRRLGQPFVQVANQFTKTHKGSGLGLAIARSLVELHGGTMKIWSTEGVGTIISIRLPWHRPAVADSAA